MVVCSIVQVELIEELGDETLNSGRISLTLYLVSIARFTAKQLCKMMHLTVCLSLSLTEFLKSSFNSISENPGIQALLTDVSPQPLVHSS